METRRFDPDSAIQLNRSDASDEAKHEAAVDALNTSQTHRRVPVDDEIDAASDMFSPDTRKKLPAVGGDATLTDADYSDMLGSVKRLQEQQKMMREGLNRFTNRGEQKDASPPVEDGGALDNLGIPPVQSAGKQEAFADDDDDDDDDAKEAESADWLDERHSQLNQSGLLDASAGWPDDDSKAQGIISDDELDNMVDFFNSIQKTRSGGRR